MHVLLLSEKLFKAMEFISKNFSFQCLTYINKLVFSSHYTHLGAVTVFEGSRTLGQTSTVKKTLKSFINSYANNSI